MPLNGPLTPSETDKVQTAAQVSGAAVPLEKGGGNQYQKLYEESEDNIRMTRAHYKFSLLIGVIFLLLLIAPERVHAQWPPFNFSLTPTYQDGKITYNIEFSGRVDWAMADVNIKIPLPKGTRFLEANAQPTTDVSFDGAEITFFTSVLHQPISNASFVVEVTDPTMTTFTTHAWIAWKGAQPGDYLTDEVSIDPTKQGLDWVSPRSRLRLEAGASGVDDIITYTLYPKNVGGRRMWDLKINVPLPEGATFLSAEAPSPFVTGFDGREVSFSIMELARRVEVEPLRLKISTAGITTPFVVTHAWATWKNVGRSVGRQVVFQEETRTGDIIVQTHRKQQVVADKIGDTPFSNYDLTSIALQNEEHALKITFYATGDIGPVGESLEFILYLDNDCRIDTGGKRGNRGAEFWVRYRRETGQAYIYRWDQEKSGWAGRRSLESQQPAGGNMVAVRVPYELLDGTHQFCWLGRAWNRSSGYSSDLPNEWVGVDPRLTQYGFDTDH